MFFLTRYNRINTILGEEIHMENFKDAYGGDVCLSFHRHSFKQRPEHVLIICRYQKKWLLTNHKERGLEFPGGKLEMGETLEEAAAREVFEETGAIIRKLEYIGEYEVKSQNQSFVKAIFSAEVERLEKTETYFETNGPVLVGDQLLEERFHSQYSFIMKDEVVARAIEYIEKQKQR